MHRFLTAFLCLSTLAMTQNVLAGTPSPIQAAGIEGVTQDARTASLVMGPELTRASIGGEMPAPGTMLLLVTGLAGLSAVGSRRPDAMKVASR